MAIRNYINETKEEMKHVSWPTRKQIIGYTIVVILISAFVAIYLGLFDYGFRFLIQALIG